MSHSTTTDYYNNNQWKPRKLSSSSSSSYNISLYSCRSLLLLLAIVLVVVAAVVVEPSVATTTKPSETSSLFFGPIDQNNIRNKQKKKEKKKNNLNYFQSSFILSRSFSKSSSVLVTAFVDSVKHQPYQHQPYKQPHHFTSTYCSPKIVTKQLQVTSKPNQDTMDIQKQNQQQQQQQPDDPQSQSGVTIVKKTEEEEVVVEKGNEDLQIVLNHIHKLTNQGSDIRGKVVGIDTTTTTTTKTMMMNNNNSNNNNNNNNRNNDKSLSSLSSSSLLLSTIRSIVQPPSSIATTGASTGTSTGMVAVLTSFASYCFGYTFVQQQMDEHLTTKKKNNPINDNNNNNSNNNNPIIIVVGHDSRIHGIALAKSFIRGAMDASASLSGAADTDDDDDVPIQQQQHQQEYQRVIVKYAGIVTTPACAAFCRLGLADAAVMITASHLPPDRNGFKLFSSRGIGKGYTKEQIQDLGSRCQTNILQYFQQQHQQQEQQHSTKHGTFLQSYMDDDYESSNSVPGEHELDWMSKHYAESLKDAILSKVSMYLMDSTNFEMKEVEEEQQLQQQKPLDGLKIVLNAGNGAGGFFATVLEELGANCIEPSLHLIPDGTFPNGVPNPELVSMVSETIQHCQEVKADLGILLDTDADRCGFVVPTTETNDTFEPLNRNRLIALLSVIFAKEAPGCAIVTDSVTSVGLSTFLTDKLGLKHVRYIKGYANVINKAIEMTNSGTVDAKMAIETSGHCAMQENGYSDDGTYTAVQIVSLLARNRLGCAIDDKYDAIRYCDSLLDLISDMKELPTVVELRLKSIDGSLDTMRHVFDIALNLIEQHSMDTNGNKNTINTNEDKIITRTDTKIHSWVIDTDNLEGIRVQFGSDIKDGQFFMLRKSLHDPIISLQIESLGPEYARKYVIEPILNLFNDDSSIQGKLDTSVLAKY